MTGTISIVGWEKHQHYGKAKPPWIKLYRDLLGNYEVMFELEPAERWAAIGLWLLAAETGNAIPHNLEFIRTRIRCDFVDAPFITRLQDLGIVALGDQSRASLEQVYSKKRREEAEEEAEKTHTHTAREPDELATWLNGHGDLIADIGFLDDETRRTLWQHYGPPGLRANAWKLPDGSSVPPPERPRLLTLALTGYATEGKTALHTSGFAAMLRRTIADELGQSTTRSNGGPF